MFCLFTCTKLLICYIVARTLSIVVPGETCTFTSRGHHTYGDCSDYFYNQGFGSLEHCLESCKVNTWCNGVAYLENKQLCRRFTCGSSKSVDFNSIFYAISCIFARTETIRGTHCIYSNPQSEVTVGCPAIAMEDSPTLKNCKYLCDDEDKCRGLTFNYELEKCSLYDCHDTTKVSATSNTAPTSFIRKICGYYPCQYDEIVNTGGVCSSDDPVTTNTLQECLSSCDVELTCVAVSFNNKHCTPHTCLSTIASGNGGNYYIKKCPVIGNGTCPWTPHGIGTLGDCLFYDVIFGMLRSCVASCDEEEWCHGVLYIDSYQTCYRYPCNDSRQIDGDGDQEYFSRVCAEPTTDDESSTASYFNNISQMIPVTSTNFLTEHTDETSSTKTPFVNTQMSSSASVMPLHSITTNINMLSAMTTSQYQELCMCDCDNRRNETFSQFLKRLVDPLKLNKRSLSSFIRKRTSADDNRTSSACLGYSGMIVLILLAATLVVADFPLIWNKIYLHRYKLQRRDEEM